MKIISIKVFLLMGIIFLGCSTKKRAPEAEATPAEKTEEVQNLPSGGYMEYVPNFKPDLTELAFWEAAVGRYPKQRLPQWTIMQANYPLDQYGNPLSPLDAYTLVGGELLRNHQTDPDFYNTCALKISRALNYSNISIKPEAEATFKGSDNKYYFVSTTRLYNFLISTFGPGDVILDNAQSALSQDIILSKLSGKKGMFVFQTSDYVAFGAYGHAGLFDGQGCLGRNCYFQTSVPIKKIVFWELK